MPSKQVVSDEVLARALGMYAGMVGQVLNNPQRWLGSTRTPSCRPARPGPRCCSRPRLRRHHTRLAALGRAARLEACRVVDSADSGGRRTQWSLLLAIRRRFGTHQRGVVRPPPRRHLLGWDHEAGCATRCRRANVLAIVIHRQEVSPMNAVSAMGAPLHFTIARLR